MQIQDKLILYFYNQLLKLYPKSYQEDYADEMSYTMQAMLHDNPGGLSKLGLLSRAAKDYCLSLFKQNSLAYASVVPSRPAYVQLSSKFSTGLVLPFFLVFTYNYSNQYLLKRAVPYANLEAKTWVIYCILMPLIAAVIVALAATKSLGDHLLFHKRSDMWAELLKDYSLLLVPLSLIIAIALM
jgi:hypothetical protein